MSGNDNNSPYEENNNGKLKQGDILENISFQYRSSEKNESGGEFVLSPPFPYAVILSQACDLDQHYNNQRKKEEGVSSSDDKILETVLVCPAFPSEDFLKGDHIKNREMCDYGDGNEKARGKALKKISDNSWYHRLHHLRPFEDKFPELIIDFKRFHTIPIEIIEDAYKTQYIVSIRDLHKERLSQRFANFLARIGLPGDSQKEDN